MKQPYNTTKQSYNTALYMRLSRDDENYGDSVSIETQRTILRNYAEENGFVNVSEYVDDGYSGTNFQRPGFQRMMGDVESGKINCIITKDLSRFGREHIMMDYYLEFIFPENHVRYIAVTENEDTEKGLSDFVPFKNLFNEWYAKDTSRKVKTALHAKFAAGQRVCTYAPLGYRKDPEQKNRLMVDEETKWIIEKIFDLAVHGAGSAKITKTLIAEHVPTAGWLNYTRYGTFANIYADAPEEKSWAWTIAQVKNILKDETYIGNSIHGKQTNISYKNKKRIRRPEEEWFRVENTHDPLISKDVFNQVQEQIAHRRRQMKDATTQIFSGLVKCADCGCSMSFATNRQNKVPYSYFNCTSYRQFGRTSGICTSHYIRYDVLYDYVLNRIRYWSTQAELGEEELLNRLMHAGDTARAGVRKKQTAELSKAEKRKAEIDRLFMKLYEDWSSGRITEYNFNMLSQKYQEEQGELDGRIVKLREALSEEQQTAENAEKWIGLIREFTCPSELTAELLNTVIKKIVVHEAVKHEDGSREQKVEIYYRFIGKIE
ncbi:MAG: recombinase family protein [Clostridia bacterium]|nr:recombinase family protein [Clostridia bacterium]